MVAYLIKLFSSKLPKRKIVFDQNDPVRDAVFKALFFNFKGILTTMIQGKKIMYLSFGPFLYFCTSTSEMRRDVNPSQPFRLNYIKLTKLKLFVISIFSLKES